MDQETAVEAGGKPEDEAPAAPQAENVPPADPVEELKAKCEDLQDKYLRALAEMDNFRKRVAKERSEERAFAAQEAVLAFLPAMDNLERALGAAREHQQDDKGGPAALEHLVTGVELIQKQLLGILEKMQVTSIPAELGKRFDPKVHQALVQEENPAHEDGVILEELQKGYQMAGRVLRPSLVKVNHKP